MLNFLCCLLHQIKKCATLSRLQEAEDNYYHTAKSLVELSIRAHHIFVGSEVEVKRQLIKLVLSNLRIEGGNVVCEAKKPFDLILNCSDRTVWLPEQDSNLRPND